MLALTQLSQLSVCPCPTTAALDDRSIGLRSALYQSEGVCIHTQWRQLAVLLIDAP